MHCHQFWKSVALRFVCRKTYLVKSGGRKFKGLGQLNQETRLYLQPMCTKVAQVQIINQELAFNLFFVADTTLSLENRRKIIGPG